MNGAWLRWRRLSAGLTLREWARRLGKSVAYILGCGAEQALGARGAVRGLRALGEPMTWPGTGGYLVVCRLCRRYTGEHMGTCHGRA